MATRTTVMRTTSTCPATTMWPDRARQISPDGEPDRRRHVAVHPRQYPGGTAYAAVYYGLAAGTYDLWAADGSRAITVSIEGNTITESVWPQGVLAPR